VEHVQIDVHLPLVPLFTLKIAQYAVAIVVRLLNALVARQQEHSQQQTQLWQQCVQLRITSRIVIKQQLEVQHVQFAILGIIQIMVFVLSAQLAAPYV
jgi:hypothetical protein